MSDEGGFDSGAFAAKMSSIGHSGNMGGGGGGGKSFDLSIGGPLTGEIGMGGDISQTIDKALSNNGILQILPVFKAFDSLMQGVQGTINAVFDAPLQSLGKLAPPATPIASLPTPNQLFAGGSKGQGH